MLRSFLLAIFHAALVLGLAGLSRIARHAGATLLATLFAAVRLLRLCGGKSDANCRNDQQHCSDDAQFIDLLFDLYRPLRALTSNFNVQMIGISPADGVHKCIDVTGRFSAEVHVIGMLVHIERQNRRSAC